MNIELVSLLKEQFSLRLQFSSKKLQKLHLLRLVRRNVARINFLLTRKENYSE